MKALVKACDGKISQWPQLLPYALWADRTTYNTVTGYMPAELITGQKPVMPVERSILSWAAIPWVNEVSREELLALRIRQLERRPEDLDLALTKLHEARLKNKQRFDKNHRLRPQKIEEGDWVLVYDSSLDNQHSSTRKFSKRWFGPYVVGTVHDNATYRLKELDGTTLATTIAGKRVKIFKKRHEADLDVELLSEGQDDELFGG